MIVEGVQPSGMRNYMATTIVDEIGTGRCHVTCSSTFDVPAEDLEGKEVVLVERLQRRVAEHLVELVRRNAAAGRLHADVLARQHVTGRQVARDHQLS